METSHRDLSNDMAERKSILKNIQNTRYSLIFKIAPCSATLIKISRWDLSNGTAEPRPILKNYQNTYYPCFSLSPRKGIAFPKTGVMFLLRIRNKGRNKFHLFSKLL